MLLKPLLRNGVVICLLALLPAACVTSRNTTDDRFRQRVFTPDQALQSEGVSAKRRESAQRPEQPLDLQTAISFALTNNHTIRQFEQDVGIAGDGVSAALSAFSPQLSAGYSYRQLDNQPGMNTGMGPFIVGEKESQHSNITLMMSLWDFGRSLGTYNQARLGNDMAELTLKRLKQQITFQTTRAYFDILRARKAKVIAEESLAQAQSHLQTAKHFFDQEVVDKNDVLRAELQVAEIKHVLVRADNAVKLATAGFNLVLGINPTHETQIVLREDIIPFTMTLNKTLEAALANRPEFTLIAKQIKFEEKGLTVAKSARYPRLYLAGGYGHTDDDYQLHKDTLMGEVGIRIDLFTGGRATASIRTARRKQAKAEVQATQVCDQITLEVKSAYLAVTEAQKRIEVMEKAVNQARENLRLINTKYKQNVVTSTDVVDAEALLTRVQSDYYNAIHDYNTAIARLENAIGKDIKNKRSLLKREPEVSE